MKIESVRYNNIRNNYAITFSDGITLIINEEFKYVNMLSCGLESYYIKKNKWPTSKSIASRTSLGVKWIEKNKNRYKRKVDNKVAKTDDI